MPAGLKTHSEHRCFGGKVSFYSHLSESCNAEMRFSAYTPPRAEDTPVPVLYYLAGLTCSEETFMIKAGAQRYAAAHGLMLVAPDTSPRDTGTLGEDNDWDLGTGAGFYLDATERPFSGHYNMYSYVTRELPAMVAKHLPAREDLQGVFGHSMGGHGALVCALREPQTFASVSAFAPISAPMRCPWGEKAFSHYLGPDRKNWRAYDASELVRKHPFPDKRLVLVDQGLDDQFLEEQLRPDILEEACTSAGQPLMLRRHEGYDHSYYFIATMMENHIRHHAATLRA